MNAKRSVTARGIPWNPPPWGTLAAVDLNAGTLPGRCRSANSPTAIRWCHSQKPPPLGTPNGGGPIITAGGLAFIAATMDHRFRAFELTTGREI